MDQHGKTIDLRVMFDSIFALQLLFVSAQLSLKLYIKLFWV